MLEKRLNLGQKIEENSAVVGVVCERVEIDPK
jgi:hypothetical protein